MLYLRQSTASQEVLIGPFVDDLDGVSPETGLTIANTDIQVWKEGGTTEADKNSGGATHIANGRYYTVLDATDTDTLGKLELNIYVSGALPVKAQFMVLSANVYDSLVLGTDYIQTDVIQVSGASEDIATETKQDTAQSGITGVKAKTDQLVFTKANELDVNVQSINDTTITGDGSTTPFNV